MATPRKFSEKIALLKQKQEENTAEFNRIMKEVQATKMDETTATPQPLNQNILECCLGNDANSGSAATGSSGGVASGGASPEGSAGGGGGDSNSPTAYRASRDRSVGVGPMRRPSERKQDRSPYGSSSGGTAATAGGMSLHKNIQNIAYLSPPMDTSWRRSNSDSALHQSLNNAVAAEGNYGPMGVGSMFGVPGDMVGTLHANYQHHIQRSHSPNIGRSYSPQAQKIKGNILHLQQQQQQQQHHMQIQQQHLQQQFQHQQQQQQQHQHQQQQSHQQQQHFNAKAYNCNMPTNSLFKSLQEQAMAMANTGSLPDLTSVHFAAASPQQQLLQQQQQQQQQTLSPVLSPHNNNSRERDQSPSPFSPGGGPPSPYHQQQHSPTSATTTPTTVTAAQTSPHLSFTNLAVQSPAGTPQHPTHHLPTLGAANSTGNLTDYRQPLNPPSPGSSPGLLTSVSGNDIHTSAPSSPIRLPQQQTPLQQHIQHASTNFNNTEKNIQTYDRYSPAATIGGASNLDSTYNSSLNPSFHNHFEQFSLGDSNSSPEQQQHQLQQHFQQQQQQHNNYTPLEFDDYTGGGDQQQIYSQTLVQNKQLDFNDLNSALGGGSRNVNSDHATNSSNATSTIANANNNNNLQQQQSGRTLANNQQQQLLNNNSNRLSNVTPPATCRAITNNNSNSNSNNMGQQNDVSIPSSIPSPVGCVPSPSSPLPIPVSPHHHQQQHHNHQQQQQHSLSLSLSHPHSAQHSPQHSPMHSPHHTSPISMSSPGLSTLGGPISPAAAATNNATTSPTLVSQQQSNHQQHHTNTTPTTANIPSIIFSDYSSNQDFSREIFDTLDLDLGQMDVAGFQMLSDPSTIMIADPTIEDSFRRDLN